jgi:hypothetical protein
VTRGFAVVLAVVGSMATGSYVLLAAEQFFWASVAGSLGLGIMLTFAIVDLLSARVAVRADRVRDRRVIEDRAHGVLLQAAGVCLHTKGAIATGCACSSESDL